MAFSCGTRNDSHDPTVVWALGEVDMAVADCLSSEIEPHLVRGSTVALDCAGITFFDSMGLQVLVRAIQISAQTEAEFMLLSVSEPVRQVLELSGLTRVFTMFDDLAQAQAELGER